MRTKPRSFPAFKTAVAILAVLLGGWLYFSDHIFFALAGLVTGFMGAVWLAIAWNNHQHYYAIFECIRAFESCINGIRYGGIDHQVMNTFGTEHAEEDGVYRIHQVCVSPNNDWYILQFILAAGADRVLDAEASPISEKQAMVILDNAAIAAEKTKALH